MQLPGPIGQPPLHAPPLHSPVGPRKVGAHPPHGGTGKHHKRPGTHSPTTTPTIPDEMPPPGYFSDQGWKFRREQFYAELEKAKFPAIKTEARADLNNLLGYIEKDKEVTDLRWIAYMLGTVTVECARTWLPIEEYGKGKTHHGTSDKPGYGDPVTVKDSAGKTFSNVYYGRGFVQLTWEKNYASCGKELYRLNLVPSDDELVLKPERALEPGLAYPVMSFGMRKGIFTGVSLKKYIHGATCDYYNARRIINGTNVADVIEGYAKKFEKALYDSSLVMGDFDPYPRPYFLA